jgi:hypothetical protein
MLKKLGKSHLKVLLIYLAAITILRWEFPSSFRAFFDLVGLWVGGVIGFGLLNLDRWIHVYAERPHEQLSQQVQGLVKKGQWKDAIETLLVRRGEQYNLAFRNGVFAVAFLPVLFFALTSTAGLFGKGIAVGVMVHFLYDAWRDQLTRPKHLNSWLFWMVNRDFTLEEQKVFLWGLTGVFGLLTLLLL